MPTAPTSTTKKLTNAQMALLELFDVEMSDREVADLRRLLMEHFRTWLEAEVDKVQKRTGKTTAEMEKEMRFTNRTKRLTSIRRRTK